MCGGDPFWQAITDQELDVPHAVLALHQGRGEKYYCGDCDIARGGGIWARIAVRLAGFPPAGKNVPTRLTIVTDRHGSRWRRDFGGHVTLSRLSYDKATGQVIERFGPIRLALALHAADGRLHISVSSMSLFGVPVPEILLPVSETAETEAGDGEFRFDVSARAPGIGLLIHYAGVLQPV